ncbi:uncharacterized protein L201_003374 [Kwoniella dendrophila CBS 6074]|uniref:histidine kinase n=1 Tax=Kwoniella dendrophila CBS 6074 TaxID=1295534 RepID=A0AAX4JUH8_9TREE
MDKDDHVPLNDQAPIGNAEWDQALKCYARDREDAKESSTVVNIGSPIIETSKLHWGASQAPSTQGPEFHSKIRNKAESDDPSSSAKPPLVHHGDSNDSLDAGIGGVPFNHPENIPGPSKTIVETAAEMPIPLDEFDHDNLEFNASMITNEQKQNKDLEPISVAFDTARTIDEPRLESTFQDDDYRSAKNERKRMKAFYEEKGWLPGPIPGRACRLRRRRAIRRLGLVGEEEDGRKAVLCKYAEMAELIFDVPRSIVSIIHDEQEFAYSSTPEKPPETRATAQVACSHVIDIHDNDCWIIADCTRDWRTRNNPLYEDKVYKFFAAAPLRYHGKDGSIVDFGTLNIYDIEPRQSFNQRERLLLMKLSNMLVYQLATLQSEYMAKRSSSMYETSVSFLRRSLLPQPNEPSIRRSLSRHSSQSQPSAPSLSKPQPPPPFPSSQSKLPPPNTSESSPVASKVGPRDSRDARRQALISDQTIFTDAANTLKMMLRADAVVVVNVEDYHLFIKVHDNENGGTLDGKKGYERIKTKEKTIHDYLKGDPWPSDIEPVINYVGRQQNNAEVLGIACDENDPKSSKFHFDTTGVESVLSQFLKKYLETRQFWWDREENDDPLSKRIMDLMPTEAQTALGTTFMGHDGKIKFVMFATWNKPPSSLVDSSMVALPFVWILGGCLMAALAMKKVRDLEQSQISYSNLQAHELRTPLHQILAITQLLRSSMTDLAETPQMTTNLTSTEQVRDLLPFLDAIDTSGKTLHGIVDNILSFLDLKGKEASQSLGDTGLMTTPTGGQASIEVMFEELLRDVIDEDKKSRRANGQSDCHIETIFEIIPPLLGEQVSEDAGGALRKALQKILSNAFKFIDDYGCVEIYLDDVVDLLPPEGCEDLALTKLISITIKDDGRGMDQAFVNDKLGEPWAKEDRYATGSGLSVHLAYRIVDLMGGCMEITSAPGAGTTVQIDVPLPLRSVPFPEIDSPHEPGSRKGSSSSIWQLSLRHDEMEIDRKVCITGFLGQGERIEKLQEALKRQYSKLGCTIVTEVEDAELIVAFGEIEKNLSKSKELFEQALFGTITNDIVFLIDDNHQAEQSVLELEEKYKDNLSIRRFQRPTNPSILRESLFPNHSQRLKDLFQTQKEYENTENGQPKEEDLDRGAINTPHLMSPEGNDMGKPNEVNDNQNNNIHSLPSPMNLNNFINSDWSFANATSSSKSLSNLDQTQRQREGTSPSHTNSVHSSNGKGTSDTEFGNQRSKPNSFYNNDIEETVASLSLGEYFPRLPPPSPGNNQQKKSLSSRNGNNACTATDKLAEESQKSNDETPIGENASNGDFSSSTLRKYSIAPSTSTLLSETTQDQDDSSVSNSIMVSTDSPINSNSRVNSVDHMDIDNSDSSNNQYSENVNELKQREKVKVLVVEDNKINRTILVKILSTKLPIEVFEAEDGDVAVDVFKGLSGPIIVLLDINMPRKDGYQTCIEMRSIENERATRQKSQIIAVTALASDGEKKRGLVECNMDEWYTKPCGKASIIRIVEEASEKLLSEK